MPRRLLAAVLVGGVLLTGASDARACTTFGVRDAKRPIVGKSYDWHLEQGMAVVNKRGVAKRALVLAGNPAEWTSKYASLTFNQYGRELPNGGINEKGLVVEVMWLDASEYPAPGERAAIGELQWIQYQLDNFATVAEVAAHVEELVVAPVAAKVHYLVCDERAECGAFEYVGGRLVVTRGTDLPVAALTNDTYAKSRAHHAALPAKKRPKRGRSSLDRFVVAGEGAGKPAQKDPVRAAFGLLERVRNGDYTKWHVVYDIRNRTAHFRTLGHRSIKSVDLRDFSLSCTSPVEILDMGVDQAGDVRRHFRPYTSTANLRLARASLAGTEGVPPGATRLVAGYPSTTRCMN